MLTLLGGFQYSDARDALPFARRRYGVEREAELPMLRHETARSSRRSLEDSRRSQSGSRRGSSSHETSF
jgi:hypothetical protein